MTWGRSSLRRLVRYAHERGVRFFETAESYNGMHEMLGIALQGVPRDSYRLMTKVTTHDGVNPQEKIDELRKWRRPNTSTSCCCTVSILRHGQPTASSGRMEFRKLSRNRLCCRTARRCMGCRPCARCRTPSGSNVAMIRMNHKGVRMDAEDYNTSGLGNVSEVVTHVKQARKEGMGVISMKLVGEGQFTQRADRQAAMKFAFRNAGVNAVTVGYKNTAEIDEAIENLNLALA